MLYYQVVTKFYDNGEVFVSDVKVFEGDKIPENGHSEAAVCDIYYDYFKDEYAAEKFRKEALNA